MKILALTYPTYGKTLHLNSTGEWVVVAPCQMLKNLCDMGHQVTVVNLCPDLTDKPMMKSLLPFVGPKDITDQFDVVWNMFRDPLQPEVAAVMREHPHLALPRERTINPLEGLDRCYKSIYLPILARHGVGPRVMDVDLSSVEWGTEQWSVSVSADRSLIRCYNYNNNRGDYPEREKKSKVAVEYLDASRDGQRSFFRIGYAMGKLVGGWLYTGPAEQLVQKTGTCKLKERHNIPEALHAPIVAALTELGIDTCHLEGMYVGDQVKIFDVNPFPTSYGGTLAVTSELMSEAIHRHFA